MSREDAKWLIELDLDPIRTKNDPLAEHPDQFAALLGGSLREGLGGLGRRDEHLTELADRYHLRGWSCEASGELLPLGEERGLRRNELVLVDGPSQAEGREPFELTALLGELPLPGNPGGQHTLRILLFEGGEAGEGHLHEPLGDGEVHDGIHDALLERSFGEEGLGADPWLLHATAAAIVGEGEAGALGVDLGGRAAPAATGHKSSIHEGAARGARAVPTMEQLGHLVELALRHHRLVIARVDIISELNEPHVEGVRENISHHRERDRSLWEFSIPTTAKSKLVLGEALELGERTGARQEFLKYLSHQGEPFRVRNCSSCSSTTGAVEGKFFQIAERNVPRNSARREHCSVATPHVVREVVHVLLRHRELHPKKELVVGRVLEDSPRAQNLANPFAIERVDHLAAIDRIAGETIGFPAENALHGISFDLAHHLREDGASRMTGAPALLEHPGNHNPARIGEST